MFIFSWNTVTSYFHLTFGLVPTSTHPNIQVIKCIWQASTQFLCAVAKKTFTKSVKAHGRRRAFFSHMIAYYRLRHTACWSVSSIRVNPNHHCSIAITIATACGWKDYYPTPCTVGWVDFRLFYIFNKSTPEICYIPSKSTDIAKKKFFDPVTASSLGRTFWVMHYIRVQNFFSQYGLHGYQNTQNFM
jgi:hypothetical protein